MLDSKVSSIFDFLIQTKVLTHLCTTLTTDRKSILIFFSYLLHTNKNNNYDFQRHFSVSKINQIILFFES